MAFSVTVDIPWSATWKNEVGRKVSLSEAGQEQLAPIGRRFLVNSARKLMLPTAGNEADEMESQRHGRGSDKESGTGKDEGREGTARDERGRKKANYQEG
ncbi:hypothetical protein J5T34_15550 [Cupriavidus gilardii]|uniref:hypothetical protein n=1 Tax=Cupriavidus gilardii TaxID=82541 RepID=UPI001ABE8D36|nr:hypothetical protein [Cupriavidus gilardii]MBO4122139.1 hypothetical protein [Cupriavidus gilardii]